MRVTKHEARRALGRLASGRSTLSVPSSPGDDDRVIERFISEAAPAFMGSKETGWTPRPPSAAAVLLVVLGWLAVSAWAWSL